MKKISAAFDGLKFSNSTLEYAVNIAESSKCLLSGVFLDSFLYHGYKLSEMIGSHGISQLKIKHLLAKDADIRHKAASIFEERCKIANINHTIHHNESFALQEVLKESIYSDLLVISAAETLSNFPQDKPTSFIRDLLADTLSPVLLVPEKYKKIEKVVLLYDGLPSSVHAIKMFNYMFPWLSKKAPEVISVTDPTETRGIPDEKLIREFVKCQYSDATYTLLHGDPEHEIVNYLKTISENALVVMGAYDRSKASRWFKSSLADVLMEHVDIPLFVAHF